MNINFYIPFPPIEFFTWLAIYWQFGILILLYACIVRLRPRKIYIKDIPLLFLASLIALPCIAFFYIKDAKKWVKNWNRTH
jgi:glucan phosphoethanolaminetransferase (alkaline phosphatase superfamily)